ncbi:hypothetical protein [Spirillospora sp. NPDC047279]|uniref:hypothetical protein n=1 Tax=Spirillospora sp. NPDC047279 TaxID=3155478 RepID=UPI003403ABEB
MICRACRDRHHDDCRGGSWCDCQHLSGPATPEQRDAEKDAEKTAEGRPAEPKVNWKRQG